MFRKLTLVALAASFAAPAFAMEPTVAEARLAAKLDLDPGKYSLVEMTRISQVSGSEREQAIEVIDKQHKRLEARIREVVADGGDPFTDIVSRNAQ